MKSIRLALVVVLAMISTGVLAQSDLQKTLPSSDAQKSFEKLKNLAGDWEGKASTDPPVEGMGNSSLHITMRVTSRGNALVHEMQDSGTPLDATKYDHPVTMFFVDNDQINLVHYCDAGNRPHMVARKSDDGKTLEFDFVDLSGGTQYGHMHHAIFTFIDANHHTEDWTYMMPGDKLMHAHMDLQRK